MNRFLLFDLDNTLVDSHFLKPLRDARRWPAVYERIEAVSAFPGIDDVWHALRERGAYLGVVTHSPRPYASRVLDHVGLVPDKLVAYHDLQRRLKPSPYGYELCCTGCRARVGVAVGDERGDLLAADAFGCQGVYAGIIYRGNHSTRRLPVGRSEGVILGLDTGPRNGYHCSVMAHNAPGRHKRKGLSLMDIFRLFPDDAAAEKWIVETRWPDGIACVKCGSCNVQTKTTHPRMPYRCRDCRKFFSPKTGTPMANSNLGYQVWAIAIYLMTTGIKGTASMKLHRDLSITQKSAWHLAMRIRESWDRQHAQFIGPVEVDETHVGGKAKSMHSKRKKALGLADNPFANKVTVAGVKDRKTGKVRATVVSNTAPETLHGFVTHCAAPDAMVYSDGAGAYTTLPRHESVNHGAGEYVRGEASINGMESFWSMLKRGYVGTYHRLSPKHLDRYVAEFEGRHNDRPRDTIEQMREMVRGLEGKQLRYKDLIADNGQSERAV